MRAWIAVVALVAASIAGPPRASAQDGSPAGALGAHFLISDGDLGAAAMLDVWAVFDRAAFDWLRIGGFFGGGAIPSERDDHNRILMPVGLSAAADLVATELVSVQLRARLGVWGGATQSEKLAIGLFAGGGAYLGFALGQGAFVHAGADVWAVIASDAWTTRTSPDDAISASTWVIAPGLGLSWTPGGGRAPEGADESEEEP